MPIRVTDSSFPGRTPGQSGVSGAAAAVPGAISAQASVVTGGIDLSRE